MAIYFRTQFWPYPPDGLDRRAKEAASQYEIIEHRLSSGDKKALNDLADHMELASFSSTAFSLAEQILPESSKINRTNRAKWIRDHMSEIVFDDSTKLYVRRSGQ